MSSVESQPPSSNVRPGHRDPHAHAADQPFQYPQQREFFEPDWTRLPGYRDVTKDQWESAQWQRAHTVKNLKEFGEALGDHLDPSCWRTSGETRKSAPRCRCCCPRR